MKARYAATAPAGAGAVWDALADVDRVLAALPGSTLVREGDTVSGSLKLRVGGSQVTYRVNAQALSVDPAAWAASLAVTGMEARGGGNLVATVRLALAEADAQTTVTVDADLDVTGRAADADETAWGRVIGRLTDAAVASPAPPGSVDETGPEPPPTPSVPPTRPAPSPPAATALQNSVWPRVAALAGLLLLLYAVRRHHRGR